jgi:hypothetical protein
MGRLRPCERGRKSTCAPVWSAGVMGTARRKGDAGNRGSPVAGEGRGLDAAARAAAPAGVGQGHMTLRGVASVRSASRRFGTGWFEGRGLDAAARAAAPAGVGDR